MKEIKGKFSYLFISQKKLSAVMPDTAEKVVRQISFKKAGKKRRHVVSGELFRFSGQQFVIVLTPEGPGKKMRQRMTMTASKERTK